MRWVGIIKLHPLKMYLCPVTKTILNKEIEIVNYYRSFCHKFVTCGHDGREKEKVKPFNVARDDNKSVDQWLYTTGSIGEVHLHTSRPSKNTTPKKVQEPTQEVTVPTFKGKCLTQTLVHS